MTPRSQSPRSSHNSPSKLSARRKDALPLESPTTKWERFQTVIDRGACGLGVVCDESGYVGARAYAHTLLHRDGGGCSRGGYHSWGGSRGEVRGVGGEKSIAQLSVSQHSLNGPIASLQTL
eukprot:scaffold11731_cov119-Isochrysis_galbana.AAC.5